MTISRALVIALIAYLLGITYMNPLNPGHEALNSLVDSASELVLGTIHDATETQ